MKSRFLSMFRRVDLMMTLASCVGVLLSYMVGAYATSRFHAESRYFGAMLACVASVIVLQGDIKTTIHQGWLRILGTFIGSVLAVSYLYMFKFTLIGMVVAVFVLAVFCTVIRIPDNGRIAIMTLIIILVISKVSPDVSPLVNGALRFVEAGVGAGIGIGLAWTVDHIEKRLSSRKVSKS